MNKEERLILEIEDKLKYCPDGICFYCNYDLNKNLDLNKKEVITCCPKCHKSFVD